MKTAVVSMPMGRLRAPRTTCRCLRRLLHDSEPYIEQLAMPICTPAFYESEAAARRYYYYVDMQGSLYLDEHTRKGVGTSLKDPKFLDFFFRRLRLRPSEVCPDARFPYLSLCGREANWVRAADTPVVFSDLVQDCAAADDDAAPTWSLQYAHSLRQPFEPAELRVCKDTGRLYHRLDGKESSCDYALIRSALAGRIAERLQLVGDDFEYSDGSGHARCLVPWLDSPTRH